MMWHELGNDRNGEVPCDDLDKVVVVLVSVAFVLCAAVQTEG